MDTALSGKVATDRAGFITGHNDPVDGRGLL